MLISTENIIQKKSQADKPFESIYIRSRNKLLNAPETEKRYLKINPTVDFSIRLQHSIQYSDESSPWSSAISAMVVG